MQIPEDNLHQLFGLDSDSTVLLWTYYETDAQKESLNSIVQGFNAKQEKYEASWEYVPMADFSKRLSVGLMQDDLPDIVLIDNPDMIFYITTGLFEDITDDSNNWLDETEYFQKVFSSVKYMDRIYGIPFSTNSAALIYNTKIFNEAGLRAPSDWEELKNTAKILTTEHVYGFGISAMKFEQATFQFLPFLLSTGVDIASMNDDAGLRAYQLFYDLIENGSLSRDCINLSQVDLGRLFSRGEIAMMINGPWIMPMLEQNSDLEWSIAELPIDVRHASVFGGENLGIIKDKNVSGALALLEYCSKDDVLIKYCQMSAAIPPKINAAQSPYWSENENYDIFLRQLSYGISRSNYVHWPDISQSISTNFADMVIGKITAEEAHRLTWQDIDKINSRE